MDGAGAAGTLGAAVLGGMDVQVVAQVAQQRLVLSRCALHAVNGKSEFLCHGDSLLHAGGDAGAVVNGAMRADDGAHAARQAVRAVIWAQLSRCGYAGGATFWRTCRNRCSSCRRSCAQWGPYRCCCSAPGCSGSREQRQSRAAGTPCRTGRSPCTWSDPRGRCHRPAQWRRGGRP